MPRPCRDRRWGLPQLFKLSTFNFRLSTFDLPVPLSPLAATFIDLPVSVANKRLTVWLNPLNATFTKNTGVGSRLWLTRHPTKGVCPERPSGERGLSSSPIRVPVLERARQADGPLFTRGERTLRSRWEDCRPRVTTSIERSRRIGRERHPSRASHESPVTKRASTQSTDSSWKHHASVADASSTKRDISASGPH